MTDAEPAGTAATHTGRPRPQDTIARDDKVYALLVEKGPLTRTQVATHLDVKPSIAYMSLFRLRRDGRVARVAGDDENAQSHTWKVISTDAPA